MESILIIGLGRFGMHLARRMLEEGNEVLALEKDEAVADRAVEVISNIQICDATDEYLMSTMGIPNFDYCIVTIAENFQSSLEITVLLKDLGAKYIISRAASEVHEKLLRRNGADHVVFEEREAAERLAITYGSKKIFDYIEMSDGYAIYEIAVPPAWYGKSIVGINVRKKFQISILATKKDGKMDAVPSPEHVFMEGETIVVMGEEKSIRKLTR